MIKILYSYFAEDGFCTVCVNTETKEHFKLIGEIKVVCEIISVQDKKNTLK